MLTCEFDLSVSHSGCNDLEIVSVKSLHRCTSGTLLKFLILSAFSSDVGGSFSGQCTGQSISSIERVPIEILPGKRHIR